MYNIFGPFDVFLWIGIVVECCIIWILFLIIEAPVNHGIAKGLNSFPDTFYWVFTTLVGGPDKAPETTGGKWIFCAHTLFSIIIAATYTGAVAAFLTSSAGAAQLNDFSSLESGAFTTVVVGPACPDTASWSANWRGTYNGGNSKYSCSSTGSVQFEYLQLLQRSSSSISFSIFTTSGLFSKYANGQTLMYSKTVDPCSVKDAQLGAFDMVMCGINGSAGPDSMFANGPSVVYELTRRFKETGSCLLATKGSQFNPSGLGIGFPFNGELQIPFSVAVLNASSNGLVENLMAEFKVRNVDNPCVYVDPGKGKTLTLPEMSGLFVITFAGFLVAFLQAIFERYFYDKELKQEQERMELENAEMDVVEECEVEASEAPASQASEDSDLTVEKMHHEEHNLDYGEVNEYLDDLIQQTNRIKALAQKVVEQRERDKNEAKNTTENEPQANGHKTMDWAGSIANVFSRTTDS
ncbi:hypothetical protein GUITHDRAFT_162922 [Guillardia theta CCMP2712]|uniref:Ionotropic glutamate receptor C-terminal domain-containing protein n=2 Tax=Guillardia theta TaxID=55529 RepID=L1JFA6_GUITC|nr:hypothetical protein GUITHDRAFT_162922 [Guillardia theta CCMP2712]EKX46765.1 hypothetical protein GUITHDRAFT_162922 [Guillardia theta CCMP2712]|eukprot:XP_005833745.1 hypothetical protein GUITHDRAFT_162922 [Guillardia theta CCMP2712]